MIYLLATTTVLVAVATVLCLAASVYYRARLEVDLGDEDDDEDDDRPALAAGGPVPAPHYIVHVFPVPPFPINHIGPNGEHDQYPIREEFRQLWITFLDRSWNLPTREPGVPL